MDRSELDLTADLPTDVLALLDAAGSFDGAELDPTQLTALLAALDEPTRARVLGRLGVKIAAVTAVASLGGTAALAATGSLPDPAQNGVSRAMEKVGVSVPRAERDDKPDHHGTRVSAVANDPELTGAEKGAAVSAVARQQGEEQRAARGDDADEIEDIEAEDIDEIEDIEAEDGETDDAGERPDNHGARVSAVAQDPELTGAEKGAAVSAVARQQGEEQRAARGGGNGDDSDDGDDDSDEGNGPSNAERPKGPPADSPGATAPGRGGRGG